jgi:hypothetical protein
VSAVCNGQERWKIKTLADPQAGAVKLDPSQIKQISVKTLRKKQKPSGASTEQRITPVETTVYEVRGGRARVCIRELGLPRASDPR